MSDNDRYVAKSEDELKELAHNCFYNKEYDKWYHSFDSHHNYQIKSIFISAFIEGYRTK